MPTKIQVFDALMEGFRDAITRRKGQPTSLRVTEIPRVKPMHPRPIKFHARIPKPRIPTL